MGELLLATLTSAASVSIITAIVGAIVGRKKLSAETAEIIDKAATAAVQRSEKEITRMESRLENAELKLIEMSKEMSRMQQQMRDKDKRVGDLEDHVADLMDEVNELRDYAVDLRDEMQRRDPTLPILDPPPKIAKHFTTQNRAEPL